MQSHPCKVMELWCHPPSNLHWNPMEGWGILIAKKAQCFGCLNAKCFFWLAAVIKKAISWTAWLWKPDHFYVPMPPSWDPSQLLHEVVLSLSLQTFSTLIILRPIPLPNAVKTIQLFQNFIMLTRVPKAWVCKPQFLREQSYKAIGLCDQNW